MNEVKIKAFLKARRLLPNADRHPYKSIVISVGASVSLKGYMFIKADHPTHTFIFFKKPVPGCATRHQWVTPDDDLQNVIFETYVFAIETILKLTLEH